jgi:hypothetical protein
LVPKPSDLAASSNTIVATLFDGGGSSPSSVFVSSADGVANVVVGADADNSSVIPSSAFILVPSPAVPTLSVITIVDTSDDGGDNSPTTVPAGVETIALFCDGKAVA